MGLLTTYDNNNKVTINGKCISYAAIPEIYNYTVELTGLSGEVYKETRNVTYYKLYRYATKNYMYVGMNDTTANNCAAAKFSQYTRSFSKWTVDTTNLTNNKPTIVQNTLIECPSLIYTLHEDGSMWSTSIRVNETDLKIASTLPANIATYFTNENLRNYDDDSGGGGGGGLTLNSVSFSNNYFQCNYSQNILGFDMRSLACFYNTNGETITHLAANTGIDGKFGPVSGSGPYSVYLKFGSTLSNTVIAS